MKFSGGSARPAGNGSGGGAVTTGWGSGKSADDPQIRVTTTFDRNGDVKDSHTTVTINGQEYKY